MIDISCLLPTDLFFLNFPVTNTITIAIRKCENSFYIEKDEEDNIVPYSEKLMERKHSIYHLKCSEVWVATRTRQFKAVLRLISVMESEREGKRNDSEKPWKEEKVEKEISDAVFVPRKEIEKFLRDRSVSDSLIVTLLEVGFTDEFIRLLKAMDFSCQDIDKLEELWVLEAKNREDIDTSVSPPSSSDEYLSADGIYLKNYFSKPLSCALREIVAKKPFDPIEYLGHWLLNYKVCEERGKREKELQLELTIERRKLRSKEKDDIGEGISVTNIHEEEEEEEEFEIDWEFMDRD